MALSVKPSPNSNGPSSPTARLLAEMFALNHNMAIWAYALPEAACRSSGKTRLIPRASRPARFSIRWFHVRSVGGIGRGGAGSEATFSSEVLLEETLRVPGDFSISTGWSMVMMGYGNSIVERKVKCKASGRHDGFFSARAGCTLSSRAPSTRAESLEHPVARSIAAALVWGFG